MVQDVWTPLSFLYMLIQHQLLRHCKEEGPYTNAWSWRFIQGVLYGHHSREDGLDVSQEGLEWSISMDEWLELQGCPRVAPRAPETSTSLPATKVEEPAPTSTGLKEYSSAAGTVSSFWPGKRKRPDEEEDREGGSGHPGVFVWDSILERPFKRRKEGRIYATPLIISARVRARNAKVMFPEMGQRCGFCRGCHHMYAFGKAQVACPYARAALSHDWASAITQGISTHSEKFSIFIIPGYAPLFMLSVQCVIFGGMWVGAPQNQDGWLGLCQTLRQLRTRVCTRHNAIWKPDGAFTQVMVPQQSPPILTY